MAYGPELIANTTFADNGNHWAEAGGSSWSFGTAPDRAIHASGLGQLENDNEFSLDNTKTYNLRANWVGTGDADFEAGESFIETHNATDGNFSVTVSPSETDSFVLKIVPVGGTPFIGYITFVSLREISPTSEGWFYNDNNVVYQAATVI